MARTAPFTIRSMTTDDIDASVELYASVAAEGRWIGREAPVDREESRRYLEGELARPEVATFLAVSDDGGPIGQIGLTYHEFGVVDLGMLVADGWRGQGVGSALLERGIEWARERESHKMTLQVWPHNERAIGLYEKYGFEHEGLLRNHYRRKNGELWSAACMGLLLDGATD